MADDYVAQERLRSFVDRIERLEEERATVSADIREVYSEAKGNGFDPKIIRRVIRLRKMEENQRQEEEYLLDTYLAALGMTAGARIFTARRVVKGLCDCPALLPSPASEGTRRSRTAEKLGSRLLPGEWRDGNQQTSPDCKPQQLECRKSEFLDPGSELDLPCPG